jgi:two-component system cell cycle sensor histidine kinase PleC
MSALAPVIEEPAIYEAPPLQPETVGTATPEERRRVRHKPIMSAGTGI